MNIVLLTVIAFILLREIPISDRLYAFLAPLGRASFGIYLVHVIVLAILEQLPGVGGWFSAGYSVLYDSLAWFAGLPGFICDRGDHTEDTGTALEHAVILTLQCPR